MGRPIGSKNKKSIWLLQSLAEHGYDYEKMLTKFLSKAALGDRHALDMAHLLVKLVPYLANMPKTDQRMVEIDTLVINRFEQPKAVPLAEGHPPFVEGEIVTPPESKDI